MPQSKKNSLIESISNVFVGLIITFIFSPLVYWVFDVEITVKQMGGVTVTFTLISILRTYIIRRFFNKKSDKL